MKNDGFRIFACFASSWSWFSFPLQPFPLALYAACSSSMLLLCDLGHFKKKFKLIRQELTHLVIYAKSQFFSQKVPKITIFKAKIGEKRLFRFWKKNSIFEKKFFLFFSSCRDENFKPSYAPLPQCIWAGSPKM